ncbi:exopolysaccharide transport family protein [Mesorhizobium sp. BR1-1-16]|uniref:GumC family protein n=1 Tax=Mesorhizobium sp. BR1-1-16 TaxID=2876653 RepID=UPI001CCCE086|nr:exopolysaccharide transport family protein [Mesorhizobium sp. BR1-1-16]MBZ9938209.1 exopolysaccharide transport family protein [Mesorhizobium sp. BR1-1-16]
MSDGRLGPIDDVELDMRALMRALGRALPILVPLFLIFAIGLYIGLSFVTPRYTAETKVLIEKGESSITQTGGDTEESRALLDAEGVASQVQLIDSRDLAMTVVAQLQLDKLPEFYATPTADFINGLLARIGLGKASSDSVREERVLQRFAEKLEVYSVDKTRVINISFSSSDPLLAAKVTNMIAEEYLALQREATRTANADATRWLDSQIEALRARVKTAEAKVESFRAESGLFMGGQNNNVSLPQQKLSDLNTEMARLEAARASADAKAEQVRKALASGNDFDIPEVLESSLVQRLREQQVALRAQVAQLSATLLPAHPRIRELNAQLADLDSQVRQAARQILSSLEGEVATAKAREVEIAADLDRAKVATAQSNGSEVQLRALEREAAAERDLLEGYLRRYREATSRQDGDYLPANARVISRAAVPLEPSFPRKLPITAAATVALLLLALAFVMVRELISGRALRRVFVEPPEPAEPGLPVDGRMRWSDGGDVRRMMPAAPSFAQPQVFPPDLQDSLRALVDRIVATGSHRLVVTMAEPPEAGRPLAAVALARQLSRRGSRVLLVDLHADGADGAAMAPESERLTGFSDLFAGEASFAQAIFRDRSSRAHIIPRGTEPLPEGLAGDGRLAEILDALDATYDHILLDVDRGLAEALAATASTIVLVAESQAGDPRALTAHDAFAAATKAEILLLIADTAPEGEAPDPKTEAA